MTRGLSVDGEAWEDHARWWDAESERAMASTAVSQEALAAARATFGKLGEATVGAAYAEVLAAREQAGRQLGAYAAAVAEHIRRDVGAYRDADADAARTLSS